MADDNPTIALTTAPETDPTALYRYRDELYAADMLIAALKGLDLFTWLDSHPSTIDGVARHFGCHRRPVDVMTTLFVAMGLLERAGSQLKLTRTAREHLVGGSPWFVGPYYPRLADRPIASDLLQILRTDRPARFAGRQDEDDWHRAMQSETFAEEFLAAMDCRGAITARALASKLDLAGSRRVLDVAGGSGIFACALAAQCPAMTASVLERPPVDRLAARAIARRGFADRVDVVAGDMLQEPLPDGYDTHLFSNVLHDWGEDVVRQLLRSSAARLPRGGQIVVHEAFLNEDKSGPLGVAAYSVLLMHVTQGRCYAVGEMEEWLDSAGFAVSARAPTALGRSAVVARKR